MRKTGESNRLTDLFLGVDIDWEYPGFVIIQIFFALILILFCFVFFHYTPFNTPGGFGSTSSYDRARPLGLAPIPSSLSATSLHLLRSPYACC